MVVQVRLTYIYKDPWPKELVCDLIFYLQLASNELHNFTDIYTTSTSTYETSYIDIKITGFTIDPGIIA